MELNGKYKQKFGEFLPAMMVERTSKPIPVENRFSLSVILEEMYLEEHIKNDIILQTSKSGMGILMCQAFNFNLNSSIFDAKVTGECMHLDVSNSDMINNLNDLHFL